ncbi:LysM peptidoglycan-binding domain-containing protein [Granulicoccus sp. GXG6511]|uniref:LysM peptidoglycan-binding domain-containing protein n=1 Tax=Granulicoccus sp. GXG6511 TaxID=3381351 RepID=UPI003D7D9FE6
MFRFVRGLLALGVLAAAVVGAPLLLLRIGQWPRAGAFPEIFFSPDNGMVLVWLLTALGWLSWVGFTLSVGLELVGLIRGRQLGLRVPGLSGPRGPAAVLLVSIAAMLPLAAHAEPQNSVSSPEPSTTVVGNSAKDEPATVAAVADGESPESGTSDHRYTVQRGDDLWTLAERFYGDGFAWTKIAAANPIITSPDLLDVGWELLLPGIPDQNPMPADPPETDVETDVPAAPRDSETVALHPAPTPVPTVAPATPTGMARVGTSQPAAVERVAAEGVAQDMMAPTDRIAYATAGISALTAAALLAVLSTRRAVQLTSRPEGRRIVHPTAAGTGFEAALGQAQDLVSLRTLDLALRALGRHQRDAGEPLPALHSVLVGDDGILLEVDRPLSTLPAGFRSEGSSLRIAAANHELLLARAGSLLSEPSPYPALACVGETPRGELHLHDLESSGVLLLEGSAELTRGTLNSLLLELSCSWWGRGQTVITVGCDSELARALDDPALHASDDLDAVLDDLRAEWASRHPVRTDAHPRDLRVRPELEEAWRPRILMIDTPMTDTQRTNLLELVDAQQVVAVVTDSVMAGDRLMLSEGLSRLSYQAPFHAQVMSGRTRDHLLDLLSATSSLRTTSAPWWAADPEAAEATAQVADEDDTRPRRAFPKEAVPARAIAPTPFRGPDFGHATIVSLAARRVATNPEEPAMDAYEPVLHPLATDQPTVLLVGPVDLVGARGERPTRAARQCMEYAAWLLEHPGATAAMMATELFVAESTRRSNMSRLRSWLGAADDGERFLPEAYSGRIQLHAAVTSDWNRMQLLTIGGVNRAAEDNLRAVLQLVRGAPLADAAPGQWHWAEELRTDISSLIRDVGLVLSDRALERNDPDLARWAVNRSLVAAPDDERLLAARVRIEHRVGNRSEVERLALRLVRSARKLNVDLSDDTVTLLQEVMEGGPRQRHG